MPSERDEASETPGEKSLTGAYTPVRVVLLTSLPAIVVAAISPVTVFFLWPYDAGYVAVMTVVMNPVTLVAWLTIASGVGSFIASKNRANIFNMTRLVWGESGTTPVLVGVNINETRYYYLWFFGFIVKLPHEGKADYEDLWNALNVVIDILRRPIERLREQGIAPRNDSN